MYILLNCTLYIILIVKINICVLLFILIHSFFSGVVTQYLMDHLGSRLYDLHKDDELLSKTKQFESKIYGNGMQNMSAFLHNIKFKFKVTLIMVLCLVSIQLLLVLHTVHHIVYQLRSYSYFIISQLLLQ